jgi:hypothetical protein
MLPEHDTTMAEADPWEPLLSYGQLCLSSLIRLSCISKYMRQLCARKAAAPGAAHDLLLQALSSAPAICSSSPQLPAGFAEPEENTKHLAHGDACWEQQVQWLLKQSPDFLQDSSTMSAVLQVHNVSHAAAAALLKNGACFTWQQLQDAASRYVPGLDVWFKVSRVLELQMHASVPQIAAAICCDDFMDIEVCLKALFTLHFLPLGCFACFWGSLN